MQMKTNQMIGIIMIIRERHMLIIGRDFDILHFLFLSACCIWNSECKCSAGTFIAIGMVLFFIIFKLEIFKFLKWCLNKSWVAYKLKTAKEIASSLMRFFSGDNPYRWLKFVNVTFVTFLLASSYEVLSIYSRYSWSDSAQISCDKLDCDILP